MLNKMTGLELMEKISKGEVKDGDRFRLDSGHNSYDCEYHNGSICDRAGGLKISYILSATFEPIEPPAKSRFEKPSKGDRYWVANATGVVLDVIWKNDKFDNDYYKHGRTFPAEQQAKDYARAERLIFALEREAWERNNGKEPLFKNNSIVLDTKMTRIYFCFINARDLISVKEKYRDEIEWYNNKYKQ